MENIASNMKSTDNFKKEAERRIFRRLYMVEYRKKWKKMILLSTEVMIKFKIVKNADHTFKKKQ